MEVTNVIELRTRTDWQRSASSRRRTPAPPARPLTQTEVVDAAARVLLRRGYQGLLFGGVARELGVATRSVIAVISDKPELVRACYRRTVAALEMGLMLAETSTGAGIQKLDAFLGSMLEIRRERGCLLPIALAEGPSTADIRWCRDKDRMIRTRLERLIRSGQHDGTIKARDPGAACQLILALLCTPEAPLAPEASRAELDDLKQLLFGGLAAR